MTYNSVDKYAASPVAREILIHLNLKVLSCQFGRGIPGWCLHSKPYLRAIAENDYGWEDPVMCVLYALNNLTGWRGPEAKRLKLALEGTMKKDK